MGKLLPVLTLLVAISFFSLPAVARAQSAGSTTANLSGSVTDPDGAAIPGANLVAKQMETNLMRETRSDENGNYLFSQLPPGSYDVTATAEGFKAGNTHLDLLLGTNTRFTFILTVGVASEIVEVTDNLMTEAGKTEDSTNIDSQRIEVLPINRRNFLDFSLTAARVVADRLPVQGATATSGLSFNGQSARLNSITIDGLTNVDIGSGSVRSTFSQDAVQEFQVVSDSYSAEFGRSSSGIVNIVTKGGSNQYHGNIFLLNRNDMTSARDVFAASKAPFSQYQFGATLGGPIKKDKAFFFFSFERLSIKQSNIVTISDEATAALQHLGFPVTNGPVPFANDTTTFLARSDVRVNANDTLSARFNFGGTFNGSFDPFGGLTAETNGSRQELDDKSLAINNIYVNTKFNLTNEARFLYGRRNQDVTPLDFQAGGSIAAPEGTITFGPIAGFQPRQERIYQLVDNTTLLRNRQQIKFGIDYNYIGTPNGKTALPLFMFGNGTFNEINFSQLGGIPGLPTLSALQAFDPQLRTPDQIGFLNLLSGALPGMFPGFPKNEPLADLSLPIAYAQSFGNDIIDIPTTLFSAFVQDDIKLKPNLLIKLGLRYDYTTVKFMPGNDGNFSPRVAFSFTPKHFQRLNIRGSYGIFFGVPQTGAAGFTQLSKTKQLQIAVIPFPFSVLPYELPGHHFPSSNSIPPGVGFVPQLGQSFQFQPNIRNGYSNQMNFGFDYIIDSNTVASLNYNFVRGIKLFATRQINPVVRPVPGSTLQSLVTGRVDPTQGQIDEFESAFDSYYHGFTASLNRRFARHFGVLTSYTFSKAIDNLFDVRTDIADKPVNPLKPGDERGLSIQDVRNRFVLSGVWDLNYTKNLLLRDFQLSSIINLTSGRPYNLLAGEDLNLNGDSGDGDRPDGLGRDVGITPGFATVDIRITRTIKIKEKYRIEGIAEIFNLFNRVNISTFSRTFPPDASGNSTLPPQEGGRYIVTPDRFRGAFSPRQCQFGFRFMF